jgi:hypothetical protein
VTSNVPAIARRVHCLRPPRESWLNDLLSPLAMKYGRGVGEITAGARNPGSFCGFVRAVRFPPSMPIPQLKASLASQLVCCRVELRPCSYRPKNKPTYCKPAQPNSGGGRSTWRRTFGSVGCSTACLVCPVVFQWHLREVLRFRRSTVPLDAFHSFFKFVLATHRAASRHQFR